MGKVNRGGRSSGRGDRQNTSKRGFAAMDPKSNGRLRVKVEDHRMVAAQVAAVEIILFN